MTDLYSDVIDKHDGIERLALYWEIPLRDKDTDEECGCVQGFVKLTSNEVAIAHYDRLVAAGVIPTFMGPEHMRVLKAFNGAMSARSLTEENFTDVTMEQKT